MVGAYPPPVPPSTVEGWGHGPEGVVVAVSGVTDLAGARVAAVLALLVPAEGKAPVSVVLVRASSVAFSDLIGGGLLDDTVAGVCEGGRFGVYLDADREAKDLPANDRAAVLLVRLGHTDRALLAGLCGDALVVGIDVRGGDCDVPAGVLVAACQAGARPVVDTVLGADLYVP